MRVAVVDVGVGNHRSVERGVRAAAQARRIPVEVDVTRDPAGVASADRVVVPGQGAFGPCMEGLARGGLGDAVRAQIRRGTPYLGICLGLQVLFEKSEEAPGVAGLGVFRGDVKRLASGLDATTGAALKIPHVGWNTVEVEPPGRALLGDAGPALHYYFVHGYVVVPEDRSVIAATTEYGHGFVSAVARGHVFACQFHPEKSARAGQRLLERFLAT